MIDLKLGDCLELMKDIPDHSVDMILCDLPYGTTNCKWDSLIDLKQLWHEYDRIAKTNAAILLFAQVPFNIILGQSNISDLRYEWIWEKTTATGHLNSKKMPMKAHENIMVFYKKLPRYNPIKTTGHTRKVSKANHKVNSKRGDVYQWYGNTTYDSTERFPRTVLKFPTDKQKEALHPTQKPVALCEYLIKTYTNEGDIVLDNCMGSASTGVACIKINRNFIGMEKETKYFEIAKTRIEKEQ